MESAQTGKSRWEHEIHKNPMALSKRELRRALARENLRKRPRIS